jgi:DNA modification methylase
MLHHFFRMFVGPYSRVLDPTCGSGAALRAAESLGAAHILGLEIDKKFADDAAIALKESRQTPALVTT